MSTPTPTVTRAPSPKKNESVIATRIFIDQVPEYDLLESCAEREVSTIVRNMQNGCGDGSRTTSYSCFCYASSTYFSSMIGAHVKTACEVDGAAQATEAVDVFNKYCQIGQTQGLPVPTVASASTTSAAAQNTSSSISSSAASEQLSDSVSFSPTFLSTTTPTPTSIPTPTSTPTVSTPPPSNARIKTIAVAIILPLFVIALLVAAALFWRARRKRHGHRVPSMSDGAADPVELAAREEGPYYAAELPVEKYSYSLAELPAQRQARSVAELPGQDVLGPWR